MKNKLLVLLFCLLAFFMFCSAEASDWEWVYTDLEDGTVEITGYKGSEYVHELVIPDKLKEKAVTSIGGTALIHCKALTSITIPDSIVRIDDNPFCYCPKLKEIKVSPDSPAFALIDGVLFNKQEKSLVAYPLALTKSNYAVPNGILKIGNSAFSSSKYLTSITIPETVTEIGNYSFSTCEGLTDITLSGQITHIGDSAFDGCKSLAQVGLPDSLVSIGDYAFSDCSSLSVIRIPDGVTDIGENPILNCSCEISVSDANPFFRVTDGVLFGQADNRLICYPQCLDAEHYDIPMGTLKIEKWAFYGVSSLKSITVPDSMTVISQGAFYAFNSLTEIILPDSLTLIEEDAFSFCTSLKSITLPENLKFIGRSAFYNCSSMTDISIPGSVTEIGAYSFGSCESLTKISIAEGVETIGNGAFAYCKSLLEVNIPSSITSIGDRGVFDNCKSVIITVPRDSYASQYCKEKGLNYTYENINDWLTD